MLLGGFLWWWPSIWLLMLFCVDISEQQYSPGLYNHSDCLYVYQEGAYFDMTLMNGELVNENLNLDSLRYDKAQTYCVDSAKPGKVSFTYRLKRQDKIKSIQVSMRLKTDRSQGIWMISQANLTVARSSNKTRVFPLWVEDIYASSSFSYSCSELSLSTYQRKKSDLNTTGKVEPHANIVLKRFQLQPFGSSNKAVFNDSYDCSAWFTIPTILGLLLIIFMFILGIFPIYYLLNIDPGDFKFVKEAQQFTQSQFESSKN